MTEEQIVHWMQQKIKRDGFTNATTLAESFLSAHHITDALDPEFSRTLDAGFRVAEEVRDRKLHALAC